MAVTVSHHRPPRNRRGGFTLIELLVVVGVVMVLLALLLSAIQGARRKAATAVCASHLRQIYQASVLFAQDNEGRLPRPSYTFETLDYPLPNEERRQLCWFHIENGPGGGVISFEHGALWRYLGGDVHSRRAVLNCPGDNDERTMRGGARADRNFTYAYNANIRVDDEGDGRRTQVRLAAVLRPGEKIMIYEELGPNDAWCDLPHAKADDIPASRHGSTSAGNPQRQMDEEKVPKYFNYGLGNHCFFDGHVEQLTPAWIIKGLGVNAGYRAYGPLTTP